jgi:hypothetical protein
MDTDMDMDMDLDMDTAMVTNPWPHEQIDIRMGIWTHGHKGTRTHRHMVWKHGNMDTWRQVHRDTRTWTVRHMEMDRDIDMNTGTDVDIKT